MNTSEMTFFGLKSIVRALLILMLGLCVRESVTAQVSESEIQKVISMESWSPKEIARLEKGDAVVRPLETGNKQELATIGVVRISRLPSVTLDIFRRSLSQKSEGSMTKGGRFSQPPVLTDLDELELDDETIVHLRACSVRDCDLNLSADVITRLQAIDWNSSDAKQRATETIREVLLNYAQGYAARGVVSLGTYDNRRIPVDLAASHRTLLNDSEELSQLAPQFYAYLVDYPGGSLANVENTLHWSIVDFGLKPSITISDAAAYTQVISGLEQFFVASRQIYSSRYLDSSLSLAILLRPADNDGVAYILFIDRSRSDALDGPFGGVARKVARQDAAERVAKMLDKAHTRLLAFAEFKPVEKEVSPEEDRLSWLMIGVVTIVLALILLPLLRRNRRRISSYQTRPGVLKITTGRAKSFTVNADR